MNWLIKQKVVDLQQPSAKPLMLTEALMLTGDDRAHEWQVEVMSGRWK
ncbi:MAG: hypothetical protein ACOX7B_11855 [Christensenellales bacterium]|jgi:hypothetical protein